MYNSLKLFLLAFFAAFICAGSQAQTDNEVPAGRLYFMTEGSQVQKGTVNFYDLPCGKLTTFDSIASFGSQITIKEKRIYVADGLGNILIYDTQTHQKADSIMSIGARSIAFWNNWLLVACTVAPYFKVYDVNDSFKEVFNIPVPKINNETDAVMVYNDYALISVNGFNGFGVNKTTDSTIAVIDLNKKEWLQNITVNKNPNGLIIHNKQLFVQSLDYATGISISIVDLEQLKLTETQKLNALSYGGFLNVGDNIHFYEVDPNTFTTSGLATYHIPSKKVASSIRGAFYGLAHAPFTKSFVVGTTDFATKSDIQFIQEPQKSIHKLGSIGASPKSFYWQEYPVNFGKINVGPDINLCNDTLISVKALDNLKDIAKCSWNGVDVSTSPYVYTSLNPERFLVFRAELPNGCTLIDTLVVNLKPKALFLLKDKKIDGSKIKDSITLSAQTYDEIISWNFGKDAQPSGAVGGSNHKVIYSSTGIKIITLNLKRGPCTLSLNDTIEFTPVSRNEFNSVTNINISPNPSSNGLFFIHKLAGEAVQKIEVYNSLGQNLKYSGLYSKKSSENNPIKIDLSDFSNGIYNVHLQTDKGSIYFKLIKE